MMLWTPGQEPPNRPHYDGWDYLAFIVSGLVIGSCLVYVIEEWVR